MTKITFHKGPPSTGKTEGLIQRIVQLRKEKGPFSYLWLGPSGGAVRMAREKVLGQTVGLYPESFRVIDQFTVEHLQPLMPDRLFIDRDFLSALITDVVSDNTALFELIKRGRGMLEQFVDFYFLLLEQTDTEAVRAEIDSSDDHGLKDFLGLFDKVEALLESLGLYTIVHGYHHLADLLRNDPDWFSQQFASVDTLVVDGFLDVPHSIQQLLIALIPFFPHTHITLPLDDHGDWIDPSWEKLLESLQIHLPSVVASEQTYHFQPEKSGEIASFCRDLLVGRALKQSPPLGVQTHHFESPSEEVMWICCQIKNLLLQKDQEPLTLTPEDIGIVIRDSALYEPLFASCLDGIGIPWRSETHRPLLESVNVHRIILPFMAFGRGFPPDLLLLIMESGLIPVPSLSSAELERIARSAGLYHSPFFSGMAQDYPKGFKQRQKEWTEQMLRYRTFLENRLKASEFAEDDEELGQAIQTDLDRANQMIQSIDQLFAFLAPCFGRIIQKGVHEYETLFLEYLKALEESRMLSDEEPEQAAVQILFGEVFPKVARLCHIAHKKRRGKVNPVKFWFYLRTYLEQTRFPASLKMDNRVRLMDLESSRFRQQAIRFYPGMTHQSYPKIHYHSLLFQDTILRKDQRQRMLERDHRDFWSSVRQTGSQAVFSCPLGDTSGNPYTPSFYFDHIQRQRYGTVPRPPLTTALEDPWAYSARSFLLHLLQQGHDPLAVLQSSIGRAIAQEDGFSTAVDTMKKIQQAGGTQYQVDVSHPAFKTALMKLFGQTMSATRYGDLKECPARFLWQHLLRARLRQESPLGFDPMQEGSIFHAILKKVFEQILQMPEQLLQNMPDTHRVAFLGDPLREIVKLEVDARIFNPFSIILEVEIDYFHTTLQDFLNQYSQSSVLSPTGITDSPYADAVFVPSQFEQIIDLKDKIQITQDPPLFLVGKIDRIDRTNCKREFLVDYKRQATSNMDIDQLMLYTYARKQMAGSYEVVGMAFLPIIFKEPSTNVLKKLHVWSEEEEAFLSYQTNGRRNNRGKEMRMEDFLEELRAIVQKAAGGDFRPDKSNCYDCDYGGQGICGLRKGLERMAR